MGIAHPTIGVNSGIWAEETLQSERNHTIIQIAGENNDQFLISVEFNGEIYSLPPLVSPKNQHNR